MNNVQERIDYLVKELDEISEEAKICPYCGDRVSDCTAGYYNEAVGRKVEMYSCDCRDYPIDQSDLKIKRVPKETR